MAAAVVIALPTKARLQCSACGASASAACDCGVSYISASNRAEAAVTANPEKSDRAIAEEIGVNKDTVAKARRKSTGRTQPVEKRTGKDGKKRKQPKAKPPDQRKQASALHLEAMEAARDLCRRVQEWKAAYAVLDEENKFCIRQGFEMSALLLLREAQAIDDK